MRKKKGEPAVPADGEPVSDSTSDEDPAEPGKVTIGISTPCRYQGGIKALGMRGSCFRITDGKLGHGMHSLTHGVPLSDVASVDVVERLALGSGSSEGTGTGPIMTDIVVRMKDGQLGNWAAQNRGAAWVREKLGPVLQDAGVPFYAD